MRSAGSKGEYKFGCRWVEGQETRSRGEWHCMHWVQSLVWKANGGVAGCALPGAGAGLGSDQEQI